MLCQGLWRSPNSFSIKLQHAGHRLFRICYRRSTLVEWTELFLRSCSYDFGWAEICEERLNKPSDWYDSRNWISSVLESTKRIASNWSMTIREYGRNRLHILLLWRTRRFFCAIPPELRRDWGKQMTRLTAPYGYLIALVYPIDGHRDGGPPFSVSVDAYDDALGRNWEKVVDKQPEESFLNHIGRERLAIWQRTL